MGGNVNNYTVDPSSDETAAAKLWAVYVSEAEKYDKALVESWKSDMEGLLIFAGLFSAILTAFLIESYKTLNSNSGDVTVHLLMQISQQLATSTSTNVSALLIPAPLPVPFTPAATSLICNALWFISLGFSLACAMLATLLQQWARDFLHKADLRSAPVIRARIFSYLYYGLQRFQMHTMVEVIPLLLHGSLLFFLCGLVAFLTLVNAAMALIAATLLVIVGGVYFGLTLLPSLYLDCPYHTPLSGTVWRVLQALKSIRRHRRLPNDIDSDERLGLPSYDVFRGSHPPIGETMIEAMSRTAMEVSRERSERDQRALVWTVKSLVDDAELEPFVEAIPDLLWGPDGPRHTYAEHIRCLAQNPDLQLSARIASLLDSCDAGILWLDVSKRRRITCYKALWAIASLSTFPQFSQDGRLAIDFSHVYGQPTFIRSGATNSDLDAFFVSAKAMMLWSTFCAVQGPLTSMRELLLTFDDNPVETSDLWRLLSTTRAIAAKFPGLVTVHETAASSTVLMPRLRQSLDDLLFRLPYTILFNYLSDSASLPSPPYRWNETRTTISVNRKVLFAAFHWHLEDCLNDVISSQLPRLNAASEPKMLDWVDTSISMLLSFWRPDDDDPIPRSILQFLNRRHSHSALQDVLLNGGHITLYLWRNFPSTLSRPLEWIGATNHTGEEAEAHTALWQLAYLELGPSVSSIEARLDILRSVLHAVEKPTSSAMRNSLVALIKVHMLNEIALSDTESIGQLWTLFDYHAFLDDSALRVDDFLVAESDEFVTDADGRTPKDVVDNMLEETRINVLAEFLQSCGSSSLPYRAAETLQKITQNDTIPGEAIIHQENQLRLAEGIHGVHAAGLTDIMHQIVNFDCWNHYADHTGGSDSDSFDCSWIPWLDDTDAREKIIHAFRDYGEKLSTVLGGDQSDDAVRVQRILAGIGWRH